MRKRRGAPTIGREGPSVSIAPELDLRPGRGETHSLRSGDSRSAWREAFGGGPVHERMRRLPYQLLLAGTVYGSLAALSAPVAGLAIALQPFRADTRPRSWAEGGAFVAGGLALVALGVWAFVRLARGPLARIAPATRSRFNDVGRRPVGFSSGAERAAAHAATNHILIFLLVVPLLVLLTINAVILAMPGQRGENAHGPDPRRE